jgi:starch synthase
MAEFQSKAKVLLIHPGTQYSYQLAQQLSRIRYLLYFITGIAIVYKSFKYRVLKFLPVAIRRIFSNRIIYNIATNELKTIPLPEVKALLRIKRKGFAEDVFFLRNKEFQQVLPDKILHRANIVIGFDTSSWIIANRCRKLGKKFILDVSIAHSLEKNRTYEYIREQYPDWAFTAEIKNQDYLQLEQYELKVADAIVVASLFTKKTLMANGIDGDKIFINPYGVDLHRFQVKSSFVTKKTIRFLFVGLLDARKGLPLLLSIWRKFSNEQVELSLVGPVSEEIREQVERYNFKNVTIVGKLPHIELPKVFHEHDVFIFPSFFEGFGLVILEAMASGLPVITTNATCGPDIIENGKEGFVVEAGDGVNLESTIRHFIDNTGSIKEMGLLARRKAEQYSWDAYGNRWKEIIDLTLQTV